jgi:hypothetical protein
MWLYPGTEDCSLTLQQGGRILDLILVGEHLVRHVSGHRKLQLHFAGTKRHTGDLEPMRSEFTVCAIVASYSGSLRLLAEPQSPLAGCWNVRGFRPHALARVQAQIAR